MLSIGNRLNNWGITIIILESRIKDLDLEELNKKKKMLILLVSFRPEKVKSKNIMGSGTGYLYIPLFDQLLL